MTILIGSVTTPAGEAALEAGLAEASAHSEDVVILNSPRRGSTVDANLVDEPIRGPPRPRRRPGVAARVDDADHGSDLVATWALVQTTDARLVVLGLRRRTPSASSSSAATPSGLLLESTSRFSRSSPPA